MSTTTQFLKFIPPPGPVVYSYDLTSSALPSASASGPAPPPLSSSSLSDINNEKTIPQGFLDAMVVRKHVFVDEQRCRLDMEIDDDDARSWHWVAYASISSSTTNGSRGGDYSATPEEQNQQQPEQQSEYARRKSSGGQVPVGTVRLVPPPHAPHPAPGSIDGEGGEAVPPEAKAEGGRGDRVTRLHDGREAYVKIGRLATVKEYRGFGMGRLLVLTALEWATRNADALRGLPEDPVEREKKLDNNNNSSLASGSGSTGLAGSDPHRAREWKGLVLAHSQKGAVQFYERLGFVVDEELGEWIEEGIGHVAMWKRLELLLST